MGGTAVPPLPPHAQLNQYFCPNVAIAGAAKAWGGKGGSALPPVRFPPSYRNIYKILATNIISKSDNIQ